MSDPPEGTEVRAGDPIAVRIVWPADDFTDAPLYDVLSCVTVDGTLDEALGGHEQDNPNQGEFVHRFIVPATQPGAEVCVRGAIAGDGGGYFERNITDDVCFTVVEDQVPSDEVPPVPEAAPAPPPPAPTPPVADQVPMEQPPTVAGITSPDRVVERPQIQDRLPKTGPRHQVPLMLAGLLLAAGGAMVAARPCAR